MDSKQPLISIVTINFRQSRTTNQLLDSLREISWTRYEVIVVDNDCGEDWRNIHLNLPCIKLIQNHKNSGFAGGNNIGIEHCRGDYILLLNNDTEVEPGFLEPMVSLMESNPEIGAVSPKIKYYDQPSVLQYAGFSSMNPITLRMRAIGNNQSDQGQYNNIRETPFAHGCAMLVRKGVVELAGHLHEDYFLYYEELDWSSAIRRAGFRIYYHPGSVVYHKESLSVQKDSPLKTYYLNRNRILYMRRNFKLANRLVALLYLLIVSVPSRLFRFAVFKDRKHLSAYVDALLWHLTLRKKADPYSQT